MIHASNVGVLEITVDRDRSMSVERKVRLGEGDISGVREAPLLPPTMIKLEIGAFPSDHYVLLHWGSTV